MKRLLILPGLFLAFGMLANMGIAQEDAEVNELRERISATVGELKQAEQTGRIEVAAELRRKVEELEKALVQRRKGAFSRPGPCAPEMRLRTMKEKLEQLRREGLADKAEQLQAEIDQFMARSEAERRTRRPGNKLARQNVKLVKCRNALSENPGHRRRETWNAACTTCE